MSEFKYHWVCCYDIRDAKRLQKVHQILSMIGIAMNYSVFYLYLTMAQFESLCTKLQKIITKDDDLRLYACASLLSAKNINELSLEGNRLISDKGVLIQG